MKKIVWLFSILLVVVAAGMLRGQGTTAQEPQFVMIQWSANSILVYRGPGTVFETVKCKGDYAQNCVLELLGQYKSKGYQVLSATSTLEHTGQTVVLEKQ